MKKSSHFILLAGLFFSATLLSQNPGYMGKRCSIGYGFYTSPGIVGSGGNTLFNILHEGYLEYAVKQRVSVGLSVRFYNAVYSNTRDVRVYEDYYSNSEMQLDGSPSGTTQIKGTNYALYTKLFRKNYLAPWGKYFLLGVTLNTFNASYNPDEMRVQMRKYYTYPVNDYKYTYYSNFGPTEQTIVRFDVLLGMGRSRIIANRIVLDYGFNVNLLALPLTLFDATDEGFLINNRLYTYNYIEKTSSARVRGVNRFNVFLKAGILLF